MLFFLFLISLGRIPPSGASTTAAAETYTNNINNENHYCIQNTGTDDNPHPHNPYYNVPNPPTTLSSVIKDDPPIGSYQSSRPPQQQSKSQFPPLPQIHRDQRLRTLPLVQLLPSPPSPPKFLPLRFLRAGKNDPKMGLQRYEETLLWRKKNKLDTILLYESFPHFHTIKQYYQHYYHYTGYNNEPCFYEFPAQTNFQLFRNKYNITLPTLLRHYMMIMEFQWQFLHRQDLQRSIYIIDLDGMTMRNVFSEVMEFMKQAMTITAQHYPERAGYIYILNVPTFFTLIWKTIRPLIDTSTLERIHILRRSNSHNNNHPNEILQQLVKHIPIEHIPPQYGGTSAPLGQSPQERILQQFIEHRNSVLMHQNRSICDNCDPNVDSKQWPCQFCRFRPARSY